MKKALKIIGIALIIIVLGLFLIPILFEGKIIDIVKKEINKNVNAEVTFSDTDLSLFRSFPNGSVVLSDLAVVNYEPFKGDTLFYGETVAIDVPLMDIIKGEKLSVNSFTVDHGLVNILINKNGVTNYDIAIDKNNDEESAKEDENSNASVNIKSYEINKSKISYIDENGITLIFNDFNHSGSGDLSAKVTKLDTKTKSFVSFVMDKQSYIDSVSIELDALLDLDLENMTFSFLENEAKLNQLPLRFDGFVKVNESKQEVDISFKTPSSDFKNFLALIPESYAKNIENVKTTGDFVVDGKIAGIVDDKHIPEMDISIKSNNASFKFPELPKSIQNIYIDSRILNTTGYAENTLVDIKKLAFRIDENAMDATAKITNLTTNPIVSGKAKGKLDLAHIEKVYPLDMKNKLSGLVNADIEAEFDMEAIEKNIVSRIKTSGLFMVNNFEFDSKEMMNPLHISTAELVMEPTHVQLKKFDAKTGSTDLHASGTLHNILAFLLTDNQDLRGNFDLSSNKFVVGDFVQESNSSKDEDKESTASEGELKVPSFLDITANVNAKKVIYDNLELSNVAGVMILKDQQAVLQNVNANMFGGTLSLNGGINTKAKESSFDMKLGIKDFDIKSSVNSIEMLNKLAPIATIFDGKLNTEINLRGFLDNQLSPKLSTIAGEAFAQVITKSLNPDESKAMQLLDNKLNFIDFNKLNLDNLKTNLTFENGKVNVKPFHFKYRDIDISLGGTHSFENEMNYNMVFNVPAKYLGSEVTKLLGNKTETQNMTVPVTAIIGGSFSNPQVTTDLESAVKNVASKLINNQKEKAIDKVFDKLLGGESSKENVSATTTTATTIVDSTKSNTATEEKKPKKEDVIKEGVKDIFNNLLKKNEEKK